MGLLYVFPASEEETDFVFKENDTITLKTYGLPYIFWIYALSCIVVVFFMFLAIKEPVLKLIAVGDEVDAALGKILLSFIGIIPLVIISFFFYEKRIMKSKDEIKLIHKIFGVTFFSEKFFLDNNDPFTIGPFLDSPNVARLKASEINTGFQNKGYFVLWLKNREGKQIQIDRHSRKADLEKLRSILNQH